MLHLLTQVYLLLKYSHFANLQRENNLNCYIVPNYPAHPIFVRLSINSCSNTESKQTRWLFVHAKGIDWFVPWWQFQTCDFSLLSGRAEKQITPFYGDIVVRTHCTRQSYGIHRLVMDCLISPFLTMALRMGVLSWRQEKRWNEAVHVWAAVRVKCGWCCFAFS